MHEMKVLQEVISELGRLGNPSRVKLKLGAMRAEPEHFRDMFSEYVKDSPLEGTELEIEEVPVEIFCPCGFSGFVDVDDAAEHTHFVRCPECGKIADVTSGNELEVEPV